MKTDSFRRGRELKKILDQVKLALTILAAAFAIVLFAPQAGEEAHAAGYGIDVSSWQGTINWQAVKQSGVQFAMVRCGNAKYGIDTYFAYNMTQAAAAGLRTGVYCYTYAQNAAQAAIDAQIVINACQNVIVSFPIAIDIEDKSLKGLTPAQQAEIVNTFCSMIYAAGYTPMVYASTNWYMTRLAPVAWDHWVAQYDTKCTYPGPYTMWQNSCTARVPGVAGDVDTDILLKDYASAIPMEGFSVVGKSTYYYHNFRRVTGLYPVAGRLYFFDQLGVMAYGWLGTGPQGYYFDPTDGGAAALGWKIIGNDVFFFGPDFHPVVGKQALGDGVYLFDALGRRAVGFYNDNGKMNYFGPDGKMAIGLTNIGGAFYYFDAAGTMQTGLINTGTTAYYFGPDGKMQTGLVAVNGGSYFFNPDGTLAVGWLNIGGGWFYFNPLDGGKLVTNAIFTDNAGVPVQVDQTGRMIAPAGYNPQ